MEGRAEEEGVEASFEACVPPLGGATFFLEPRAATQCLSSAAMVLGGGSARGVSASSTVRAEASADGSRAGSQHATVQYRGDGRFSPMESTRSIDLRRSSPARHAPRVRQSRS